MEVIETFIKGLYVLQPKVFYDERGYFFESYNKNAFESIGISHPFIQDNESKSSKNVLRGLHFQAPPFEQGKLVRVIKGRVLDVAVDIRKKSKTYGKYYSIELSEDNKKMFWIPPGFAHGFVSLEENTIFSYKCTNVYHKQSEGAIIWNDPTIKIDWTVKNPLVSEKDALAEPFNLLNSPFE